jgi:hypothetical protein
MATYYKTDPETFIEAYGASGVDLRKYAPSGNINTKKGGGSTSKPAPAKTASLKPIKNPLVSSTTKTR